MTLNRNFFYKYLQERIAKINNQITYFVFFWVGALQTAFASGDSIVLLTNSIEVANVIVAGSWCDLSCMDRCTSCWAKYFVRVTAKVALLTLNTIFTHATTSHLFTIFTNRTKHRTSASCNTSIKKKTPHLLSHYRVRSKQIITYNFIQASFIEIPVFLFYYFFNNIL